MVKVSTKLVLGIQEYLKMPGSEMPQWEQIQWPWPGASCIYTLTFCEDALGSEQPGKCSLWSSWILKISISHSATWYGEMWDGAGFFFFFWHVMWDLNSPTREQTHTTCGGSTESQPLDHQGNPWNWKFWPHNCGDHDTWNLQGLERFLIFFAFSCPSVTVSGLLWAERYLKVSEIPWKCCQAAVKLGG